MTASYELLGIDDEVTTCECCGKTNLKCTAVLAILDADSTARGEVRFGRDCAARALRVKMSADKLEGKARAAEVKRLYSTRAGGSKRIKVVDGRFPVYATIYPLADGRDLLQMSDRATLPAGDWRPVAEQYFIGKAT